MSRIVPVLIASVAFLIAVLLGTQAYRNRNRPNDLISVTGLARRDFDSDLVVWTGHFTNRAGELKEAFHLLKRDREVVKKFLAERHVSDTELTLYSVSIDKEFDHQRDKDGNSQDVFLGYRLTQSVRVESMDIGKAETIARDVTDLIDSGVEFYSDAPEYYYTKLGELKIEMIAAATQDGRQRAEKIAENAKAKLGGLRYSNLGVFQIMVPNSSSEMSWQGSFDTSSRRKTAAITIKLQFGIQ